MPILALLRLIGLKVSSFFPWPHRWVYQITVTVTHWLRSTLAGAAMSSTSRNITSNFASLGITGARNSKSIIPSPEADVVNVAFVVAPNGMKVRNAGTGVSVDDHG